MIRVEGLTKGYSGGRGIRDVSFRIEQGRAFGFLGPNGAGKTTTIRLLMGYMKPTQGKALINGRDCWREREQVKTNVGYLPGELRFIENLTGLEFLQLMEGMHGERPVIKQNRKRLAETLDLDWTYPIRKMSKGMKQKLGIILALMRDAEVLLLDEPTSGLDPLMQKSFIGLLLEEKKRGKTILMSSHQFQEVERVCDQVGIIREGELLAVSEISELQKIEYQTLEIEVEREEDVEILETSGLDLTRLGKGSYLIRMAGEFDSPLQLLSKIKIKRFRQHSLELEEAFMQYYH